MQHNRNLWKQVKELANFYAAIEDDHRIGTTHISLYMALFHVYNSKGFQNPIEITRASVMQTAKIRGIATYHRCIRDLQEFGYIVYTPSYNPAISSTVQIIALKDVTPHFNRIKEKVKQIPCCSFDNIINHQ